jgi:hypothetical protein
VTKENGIVMLTLPPHTLHKLQPLDRTVFGPYKAVVSNRFCTRANSGKIKMFTGRILNDNKNTFITL